MMRALPFTEAAIRRAIRAAEKAGYHVGGLKPDGTVLVYKGDQRPASLSLFPIEPPTASSWDDR